MSTEFDFSERVAEIAEVILFLCSDAAGVTSGAAVPVYGDARATTAKNRGCGRRASGMAVTEEQRTESSDQRTK